MKKRLYSILLILLICAYSFAQNARVQVIHNSPDDFVETVDVYANDVMIFNDVSFRTATPFIDVPSGVPIQIDIAPSTSTSVAESIANFPLTLTANETYVVVADGITGLSSTTYTPAPAFNLEIYAMGQEAAGVSGNTDVLVHHGSTDAPTVDVFESSVSAGTVVDDASYGDFSGYLPLATADYRLEIQDMTGSTVVASYEAPLATLGLEDLAITVVASGFLDPSENGDGPAFGLWVALPTGGALVELPISTLSITNVKTIGVQIYPNPVETFLNVNLENSLKTEVKLFDFSGRMIMNETLFRTNNLLDVNGLTSGIYLLNVSNKEGEMTTKIIVK